MEGSVCMILMHFIYTKIVHVQKLYFVIIFFFIVWNEPQMNHKLCGPVLPVCHGNENVFVTSSQCTILIAPENFWFSDVLKGNRMEC